MRCPPLDSLGNFLDGVATPTEADGLVEHFLECDVCCSQIQKLPNADRLAGLLDPKTHASIVSSALRDNRAVGFQPTLSFVPPAPTPADEPARTNDTLLDSPPQSSADTRGNRARAEFPEIPGYEVLGELGRGGMGVVYKARHVSLDRIVALKVILAGAHADKGLMSRFHSEAKAIAKLKHVNIVQVYDIGECLGLPYFSLEYVDGGSLEKVFARTAYQNRQAAHLVEVLARAVHVLHESHIIHRDLKPANILLSTDGTPKITDFGLAKSTTGNTDLTMAGSIVGSPNYMAPEQAEGKTAEVGPAADIYALGAVLYTALTGRAPFRGSTVTETLAQVRHDEPPPPSRLQQGVARDLETICLKCLAKSPSNRYASALNLAADVRRYLDGEPIQARPVGKAKRLWRWCRRNPVPTSLLLAISAAAVFCMACLWQLSNLLVRAAAIESAAQHSELFDGLTSFYGTSVVDRLQPAGIAVSHKYTTMPGTLPDASSLAIDLGKYISDKNQTGIQVRIYSDAPFKTRANGGPHDEFERVALERLRTNPTEPYLSFEDVLGRASVRYATAKVMIAACVECHNHHPDSPCQDWKVGDVRGVLEIIRPLDHDEERTWRGLRGTFVEVGVISGGLLVLSMVILVRSNRKRSVAEERV